MKKFKFAALLAVAAIILIITPTAAKPLIDAEAAGEIGAAYDYAQAGDVSYTTLRAADVLTALYGDISDFERNYLAENDDFALRYSTAIRSFLIKTEFIKEETGIGALTVTAEPYEYKAKNGEQVVWLPLAVNGEPTNKQGESTYVWQNSRVADNGEDAVTVEYSTQIAIRAATVNEFAGAAFAAAKAAHTKLSEESARYSRESAKYAEALQAYEKYLADKARYEADSAAYREYLLRRSEWQSQRDKYDAYLAERAEYEKELAAYEEYVKASEKYSADLQKYRDYLAALADYEKELEAYERSVDSPEKQAALYHLSVLKFMNKPLTSMKRTLAAAILGDSVTQVLAERETLIKRGKVEAAVIDTASNATLELRKLIRQYDACTTDESRYYYYIACYESLRDNFCDLLRSLDYLYQNPARPIPARVIKEMDKQPQFRILLAQLYYICNALTDGDVKAYEGKSKEYSTKVFDAAYRIDGLTPLEILENEKLSDEECAAPLDSGYPNLPSEPVAPEEVALPTAPKEVRKPAPPTATASDPGAAPAEVSEPVLPEEVIEPVAPKEYLPTAAEQSLDRFFESEDCKERAPLEDEYLYTAKASVKKYFRREQYATVRFWLSKEAQQPVYVAENAEIGLYVEYPYAAPSENKRGFTCEFIGWVTENGELVNMNSLPSGLGSTVDVYPLFRETVNKYRVIWKVGDVTYEDYCEYGGTPVYDEARFGVPRHEGETARAYRFAGWRSGDKTFKPGERLAAMSDQTVCYEAVFEAEFIIVWSVDGKTTEMSVWPGETPEYGGIPERESDGVSVYTFKGWDHEVTPASRDEVYTAVFLSEYIIGNANGGGKVTYGDGMFYADCKSVGGSIYTAKLLIAAATERGAGITLELRGAVLTIDAASVRAAAEAGAERISVGVAQKGRGSYDYHFTLYDKDGEISPEGCTANIAAACDFVGENTYLFTESGDVRFTPADGAVKFTMRSGIRYSLREQYVVTVAACEYADVSASAARVSVGERVEIYAENIAEGMQIEAVYAICADGNEITVEGMSFIMPAGAVNVGVVCTRIRCTVEFRADGKTVSVKTCYYGESVEAPADPVKRADDKYEYEFVGWSASTDKVTCDMVVEAEFAAHKVMGEKLPASRIDGIMKIVYAALGVVGGGAAIAATAIAVVKVRKKRQKNADTAKSPENADEE